MVNQDDEISGIDGTLDPGSRINGNISHNANPLEGVLLYIRSDTGAHAGLGWFSNVNGDYSSSSGFPAGSFYVSNRGLNPSDNAAYIPMVYPNVACGDPCDVTLGDLVIVNGDDDVGSIDFEFQLLPIIFMHGFEDILVVDIPFIDSALETCVEDKAAQEGWVFANEMTDLNCAFMNISSLSGLEFLMNLTGLGLCCNQIGDIAHLQSLVNLVNLDLNANDAISPVSTFASLTNLQHLGVGDNQINDISFLANLTNMTSLQLMVNQIENITPLELLDNLVFLDLNANLISNVSVLADNTLLDALYLGANRISDVSSLHDLDQLKTLILIMQENPPGLDCTQQQSIVDALPTTDVQVDDFWNDPDDDPDLGNIPCGINP